MPLMMQTVASPDNPGVGDFEVCGSPLPGEEALFREKEELRDKMPSRSR